MAFLIRQLFTITICTFFYVTADGPCTIIGEYQPASNSLKVYPNPDGGSGYWDQPIVYDNNLYFQYYNVSGLSQLGYFGGSFYKIGCKPYRGL
jgi:streptogramin lyase